MAPSTVIGSPDYGIDIVANMSFGEVIKPTSGSGSIKLNNNNTYTVTNLTLLSGSPSRFRGIIRDKNESNSGEVCVEIIPNTGIETDGITSSDWRMKYYTNIVQPSTNQCGLDDPYQGVNIQIYCQVNVSSTAREGSHNLPEFAIRVDLDI